MALSQRQCREAKRKGDPRQIQKSASQMTQKEKGGFDEVKNIHTKKPRLDPGGFSGIDPAEGLRVSSLQRSPESLATDPRRRGSSQKQPLFISSAPKATWEFQHPPALKRRETRSPSLFN
ncbi:Hypothetical predicted protein [Podarcis lilfordi]|uniref:Uncharacterized protein n=1 Tax=Podarcis lilfordi TaxID=74358 RepID=A0AA35LC40_9SAUR|nr:Hypothetical predicted protein [Podarcis lilfordi]